jgi:hypothetical protein
MLLNQGMGTWKAQIWEGRYDKQSPHRRERRHAQFDSIDCHLFSEFCQASVVRPTRGISEAAELERNI